MNTLQQNMLEARIAQAKAQFGEYLYHYTSIETLYKILTDKTFLFGNTANMNDTSELMDFVDRVLSAVIDEVEATNPFLPEDISYIKDRAQQQYPFAMCFSYSEEDAALWERYANNGKGVCIAFNLENLYKIFAQYWVMFNSVFYEYDEKEHEHVRVISDFIKGRGMHGFQDLEGIINNLTICAAYHKHKSFISEKEVRLVFLGKVEPTNRVFIKCGDYIKSMIKVDVDMLCNANNTIFESLFDHITLGPRSSQRLVDLKEFIEHLGYESLAKNICHSTCPLR